MLLDHNLACREPLLHTLEKLSNDKFVDDLGVGRGSIRNILTHLINTERYWISVLNGIDFESIEPESLSDIQSVREVWSEINEETRNFIANLREEQLSHVKSVAWENQTVSFTIAKALIHMANHETHHRGLLTGLIRLNGLEAPDFNMI